MSNTKKLFESFQNNLAEIEKNIKTIIVKLSDSRQAEIEVEDGNHIRKIWYTNNNGSTGFNYDEKSDKFINFNNPNGNFLTDREDKTIKDKIHEILNNKMNEDENIDGQISFDDLERAKNPIFKYYTKFNLASPVNDFEEAQAYLTEDDMTQYLLSDDRIPQSGRDKVKSVAWDLEDDDSGTIWVITTAELTEEESSAISDWIAGQNSDGLGEGFEQQSFAESYYNPETGEGPFTYDEAEEEIEEEIERLVEEQYEDYLEVDIDEATDEDIERAKDECRDDLSSPGSMYDIDDWYTMSSFDWQYNKYKLTLKDMNESVEYKNNLNEVVKDESLDNDFLEYLLSETEINRRGEISYLPDFEDAENYKDLTEEEYNKSIKYLEDLINNAKFYYSDGELFIELNDNHTFWDIDNDEIGDIYIGDYLEPYFDAFEEDTGVELWQAGRSGRHIVVKLNLENLERYDELKLEQERQEQAFIEEMNNLGKEDDLDESALNESGANLDIDLNTGVLPIVNVDLYSLSDRLPDSASYEELDEIIKDIAPKYIEETIQEVLPSAKITANKVYHPSQYNYSGDELEFNLTVNQDEYENLRKEALSNSEFENFLKSNYSSRSGFISSMPNNIEDFNRSYTWQSMVQVIMFALRNTDLDSVNDNYLDEFLEEVNQNFDFDESALNERKDLGEGFISDFKQKRLADKIGKIHSKTIPGKEISKREAKTYDKAWKKIHELGKKEQEKELVKTRKNNEKSYKFSKKADEHLKKANNVATKIDNMINSATEKYLNTNESNLDKVRKDSIEKGLLTEDYNPLSTELYMNTWGNYNINGADVEKINGGWMDIDKAKEFLEAHKDEEPFINDTNDCPIEVSEYDNPWEVIEHLEKIEELDNTDAFLAILEEHNDNFDEALDIYESGDFTFFPGVDNDKDLGIAWVNMVGGLEGVTNVENYIDEEAYRESWREAAESSVREDNPDIDEDSDEFESLVERWLDSVVDEQLQIDIDEGNDLSDYFDYEDFGRELNFGGFYYASTGAIETY